MPSGLQRVFPSRRGVSCVSPNLPQRRSRRRCARPFGLRRDPQHRRFRAIRRCRRRRARPSSSCPATAWRPTAGSSSSAMPGSSPSSSRRAAITPAASAAEARTWSSSSAIGVDHGQVRIVDGSLLPQPLRLRRLRLQPVLLSALRPLGSDRPSITAGTIRSGTAAAGSTATSNIIARSISTSAQPGPTQPLFDGRAQARSQTNRLDVVVPSLVEAMFTGFPGQSGETVKITIPARPRAVTLGASTRGTRRRPAGSIRRAFSFGCRGSRNARLAA